MVPFCSEDEEDMSATSLSHEKELVAMLVEVVRCPSALPPLFLMFHTLAIMCTQIGLSQQGPLLLAVEGLGDFGLGQYHDAQG